MWGNKIWVPNTYIYTVGEARYELSFKSMALFQPLHMTFYHGGKIEFVNGALRGDDSTSSFTIYAANEMRYEEFLNLVEKHSGIERLPIFTFRFTLHFNYCGKPKSTPITNDETLKVMFFLAKKDPSFRAQLHLEKVEVPFDELAECSLKNMASFQPFLMSFYHGGKVKFVNGALKGDNSTSSFTILAAHEMSYETFAYEIEKYSEIDGRLYMLKISLHYEHRGTPKSSHIKNDETLKQMFLLAKGDPNFCAEVHVETEEIPFDDLVDTWTYEEICDMYWNRK
ncbi:hypothetical protein LXL04_008386 [Taraxacum kok-saghyz]